MYIVTRNNEIVSKGETKQDAMRRAFKIHSTTNHDGDFIITIIDIKRVDNKVKFNYSNIANDEDGFTLFEAIDDVFEKTRLINDLLSQANYEIYRKQNND